MSHPEKKKH